MRDQLLDEVPQHLFHLLIWSLILKLLLRGYLDFNQLQAASIPFFDQ